MSDTFRITPYQVRSAGTDVPPEEVQAAINSLATQTTIALNSAGSGTVNITGGTIANVSISNSTAVTQSRIDNSTLLATDQFVNQQIASASANVPIPLTGGIYNQASLGTGTSFVIFASGGVISSVITVISGGTGYAVGDLLLVIGGNYDALARVTNVVGGVIQSGGLQILYGGTGYTTGATTGAVPVPPGQRSVTLTGVLTSNVTFIIQNGTFLTAARRIEANNNTTGAFTVTVKLSNGIGGTTGTGVVLPQGTNNSSAVLLQTDGANDVWLADTPLGIGAAPIASPALTGTPTAPTAAPGTNTTQIATTAFVATSFAPLASPALTGTPTAPTAAAHTNTTQVATTAFVETEFASPPTAGVGAVTPSPGAFTTLSSTGTFTPSQTSGIVGTTTNNNANAGSVGEFVSNSATGVALTTTVTANITSISLTAGDWDVTGVAQFSPAGTTVIQQQAAGASSTSATVGGLGTLFSQTATYAAGQGGLTMAIPTQRFSLSATTTIFAVGFAVFTTSTCTASAFLRARRVR